MKKYIDVKELKKGFILVTVINYDRYQIDVDKNHIKLHKKIITSDIFKDPPLYLLFTYCIIKAKIKDDKYPVNDKIIELERSQFVTNYQILAGETGITHRTLKKKLNVLCGDETCHSTSSDVLYLNTNTNTNISIKNKIRDVEDCLRAIKPTTHRETISYFCGKHFGKTGAKYHVQGAKDGALVKKLLQTYSLNEIKKMIDAFFNIKSDFVENKAGYTIGVFYKTMGTTIAQMKKASKTNFYKDKYAELSR